MNRDAGIMPGILLSAAGAKALDEEASAGWGLNPFALVEAAGRACAQIIKKDLTQRHKGTKFRARFANSASSSVPLCLRVRSLVVLAGKGNNAADALVMLRALILSGYVQSSACAVFAVQVPEAAPADGGRTPLSQAMLAVRKLGVPVRVWDGEAAAALAGADFIIDGIAGTGLAGPLRGIAREMAEAVNALDRDAGPCVVSIDIPSGNFDGWQKGMPIVRAHATLAIEPRKLCLYTPAARPYAGAIIPVGGIFPPALVERYREAELVEWEDAAAKILPVAPNAYKYERGVVEIRAGSPGAAGAAKLAALGAQSAGAGLVRLIVDPSLYPVIAPGCTGIMASQVTDHERFPPAALLLGPGWGRSADRSRQLEACLPLEERGIPLILDADAIAPARDIVFHGNAILTPHPGEFAAYSGCGKDELLDNPVPALRRCAAEKKAHILFKSHVLYAASPDGRIGVIDGMKAALAAGGSGDVLAGFCAAIAARHKPFDGYACICAAASLLIESAASEGIAGAFIDPAELAKAAAAIAGKAWL